MLSANLRFPFDFILQIRQKFKSNRIDALGIQTKYFRLRLSYEVHKARKLAGRAERET